MSFFVFGINHHQCPVEIREKLHFSSRQLDAALFLSRQFPEIGEIAILSTCNRVEIYGHSEGAFPEEALLEIFEGTHETDRTIFLPYFYRLEGREAMQHLFRVASGLDSLVIGENEILGQLREAFRIANEAQTVQALLYRLMEKALKVGKDVRTQTKINEGAISIPSVAVELAGKIFGKLTGEKIMILGAGEMAELTLKNLKSAGAEAMYVSSRSQERGEDLAQEFGAEWIPFESWEKYLGQVDILISSTAAPHAVVHYDQVKQVMSGRRRRPLFLIDIAIPRDIESEINAIEDVYLYNIDDLKGVSASNLKARRKEIEAAEVMVEKAVSEYQAWLEGLKARPTMELFQNFIEDILEKETTRFAKENSLSAESAKSLKERIRAKLMHPPLEKIKDAAQTGGVRRYLEALRALFDLDRRSAPDQKTQTAEKAK